MKSAILTAYQLNGHWSTIGNYTSGVTGLAADCMGCRLLVRHDIDLDRPAGWNKARFILDALCIYDPVMWIDADACIVQPFKFAEVAAAAPIVATQDYAGISCGVMWFRRNDWVKQFLDMVGLERVTVGEVYKVGKLSGNIGFVPAAIYNSYQRTDAAFIIHAAGIGVERKLDFLCPQREAHHV